jgi:hydrogenase maturation factor HypE
MVRRYNTTYERRCNLNLSSGISLTGTNNGRGIWTGSKTASNIHKFYRNSSVLATGNGGGTLTTRNLYIGAFNNGGVYGYSNQRIQFTAFHEGLSDAEVATLHTIIDTFETALGRKTW